VFHLFLVIVLLAGSSECVAYGFRAHSAVNLRAIETLPDEMRIAFAPYAELLSKHASDPDRWKESNPKESHKHWIHLEFYSDWPFTSLTRDFNEIENRYAWGTINNNGRLIWTIVDYTDSLTAAMADGRWMWATYYASALGHYVADGHQPLHTTTNYDGQETGNDGIHLRFEIHMLDAHWDPSTMRLTQAQYVEDVFDYALCFLRDTHSGCELIMRGDNEARSASAGRFDSTYYEVLWDQTGRGVSGWLEDATSDLGSLWYTAWVDAGRPDIPEPPQKLAIVRSSRVEEVKRSRTPVIAGLVGFGAAVIVTLFTLRK
jgi:hypothetical protein